MRTQIICLASAVLSMLVSEAAAQQSIDGSRLEVFRASVAVTDERKSVVLEFWLQQLMLSSLYRDVIQESSLEEWQRHLSSPTRIHCRYAAATELAIPDRSPLHFDEALLPLPSDSYPAYIYIKHGQRFQRLAKYDPWVLFKLVSEANLGMYEDLSEVRRGLF